MNQQNAVDVQGKKITDLEGYIDNLLSKVIEVAPVVLQKDIRNANRFIFIIFFHCKIYFFFSEHITIRFSTRDQNLDDDIVILMNILCHESFAIHQLYFLE